jgi:putative ABC transport system ATP-binding protein
MTGEVVVAGRGVTKTWPAGGGLSPIDFDLAAGSLTAVRGRSGSGKSTLVSILAGWVEPTAGRIDRRPDADFATWRGTAVVPQALGLVSELSVHDNIALPVRLGRRSPAALDIAGLMTSLDLADHAARLPSELSLGQRQRVAIARALVLRPVLVLIDEPTSHQDGSHAEAVMSAIRTSTEAGSAVLLATHDPTVISQAERLIDLEGERTSRG